MISSVIKKSIKFAYTFRPHNPFSILFLGRKDTISPFDNLIRDIIEEDLKN